MSCEYDTCICITKWGTNVPPLEVYFRWGKKSNKIRILVKKVQRQEKDFCGFYSAAFATAICNGIDPEQLVFDEDSLPMHFLQCLNENKITMFPHTKKRTYKTTPKFYEINLQKN